VYRLGWRRVRAVQQYRYQQISQDLLHAPQPPSAAFDQHHPPPLKQQQQPLPPHRPTDRPLPLLGGTAAGLVLGGTALTLILTLTLTARLLLLLLLLGPRPPPQPSRTAACPRCHPVNAIADRFDRGV
jgi:hypothetical protein